MQSIASGLLGPAAYNGGAKTAFLGVVLHYFIATTATAIFYFASRKLRFLINWPVTSGVLYGVAVYAFMNFIVLPLSAFQQRSPVRLSSRIIGLTVIIVCIGLPISIIVRRFSKQS